VTKPHDRYRTLEPRPLARPAHDGLDRALTERLVRLATGKEVGGGIAGLCAHTEKLPGFPLAENLGKSIAAPGGHESGGKHINNAHGALTALHGAGAGQGCTNGLGPALRDRRVDLGRAHIFVSQQFLYGTDAAK